MGDMGDKNKTFKKIKKNLPKKVKGENRPLFWKDFLKKILKKILI
jgi:hypothetical protein